jgi:cytochrome b561
MVPLGHFMLYLTIVIIILSWLFYSAFRKARGLNFQKVRVFELHTPNEGKKVFMILTFVCLASLLALFCLPTA